ncbi:PH domain-containing protein [Amycolatopsis alkalitolerans]|uniref:PH domain-containing protein n=1 Tax=Amycolatopsis alkalitolerans TaxID=2547244 RepID=A0A5C4M087_9PSEU|nr:PH domain-containing protein [Amycolatopsis alkalitolerans]
MLDAVRMRPAGSRVIGVPLGLVFVLIGLGAFMEGAPIFERLWFGVWLVSGLWQLFAACFRGVTLDETGVTEQGWTRRKHVTWDQVESVELGWVGATGRTGRSLYGPVLKLNDGKQLRIRSLGAPIKPKRLPGSRAERETDSIRAYFETVRDPRR